MGGKKKVYQATWLQKVEPVYFAKDSAGITLTNTDGASFGSLLKSEDALSLLTTAMDICRSLPGVRPDQNEPSKESYAVSEIDRMEIFPGRGPEEIRLQLSGEGLRLAFYIDLDMFMQNVRELLDRLNSPGTPETMQ